MDNLKGILTILFLLFILIAGAGLVSATQDNQTLLSDGEINITGGNFVQIEERISQLSDGGTVNFINESYSPDKSEIENGRVINVKKPVNLVGIGSTTIDARNNSGILNIEDAGNVVIKNIRFTKAYGSSPVNIKNSNVTFIDCIFEYNRADSGAGINVRADSRDVTTNIIGCSFIWNLADFAGAQGIGGAVSVVSHDCIVETNIINSSFENNSARRGGSVYISGDGSKTGYLNVDNCRFFANFILPNIDETEPPEITGADISVNGISDYEVNIISSNFTDDRYPGEGKGNRNAFEYSLVLTNYRNNISKCNFINNTICFEKTDSAIIGCNFTQAGIGVYFDVNDYGEVTSENIKLNISNSSFFKSDIELGYGLISNSDFTSSFIYKSSDNDFTIDSCKFSDESIVLISGKSSILNSNFTKYSYIDSLTYVDLLIDNSNFINGMAMDGAAVLIDRYDDDENAKKHSEITITNSNFINNTARYWGGAIYVSSPNTSMEIINCTFVNNSARNGGAIYSKKATSKVSNCVFDENKAQNNDNITHAFLTKNDIDISSEYQFKYYDDEIYARDVENYNNKYHFPEYVYGRAVKGALSRIDYYGSAVFGDNLNIDNNFWGMNIASCDELFLERIIGNDKITPENWLNYENNTYVSSNKSAVSMPDYIPDISIINKKTATLIVNITGNTYGNVHANLMLIDNETGDAIANQEILVVTSYGRFSSVFTNESGNAVYNIASTAGNANLLAICEIGGYKVSSVIVNNIRISKREVTGSTSPISTAYASGGTLKITVSYKDTKKPAGNVLLALKIFTAKKCKTYHVRTNSKGLANFKVPSLSAGTHNVEITAADGNHVLSKLKTKISVTKLKTKVKAPKVTNKYKKSKYFKVTVVNKATKKAIKNLKLKVKVAKKTYTIKTNSKGIAKLNIKSLKIGRHKVVISSLNSNYAVSAKSTIVIKR